MKKVGILMGSDSDLPVVQKAIDVLRELEVPFEAHVMSAHRTPEAAAQFAKSAMENGYGVLIGAAGMAAHLAGALAANTVLPVIGLPIHGGAMDGLDALLATVEMPWGIPVATVAIDGGTNAGLLAAEMLALEDEALRDRLIGRRKAEAERVLQKDDKLQKTLADQLK